MHIRLYDTQGESTHEENRSPHNHSGDSANRNDQA